MKRHFILFIIAQLYFKQSVGQCKVPPKKTEFAVASDIPKSSMVKGLVLVDTKVTYKCIHGYLPNIGHTGDAVCKKSGGKYTWEPKLKPSCYPHICEDPMQVLHGRRDITSWTVGSKVEYFCDTGYQLTGPKIMFCFTGSTFFRSHKDSPDNEMHSCDKIKCGALKLNPNSKVKTSSSKKHYEYQDEVTIECPACTRLIGNPVMTCLATKLWSTAPRCEVIKCQRMHDPPNATIQYSSLSCGTVAKLKCNQGATFRPTSPRTTKCTAQGVWDKQLGGCLGGDKQPLGGCVVPNNDQQEVVGYAPGQLVENNRLVVIACKTGFKPKKTEITCLSGLLNMTLQCNAASIASAEVTKRSHAIGKVSNNSIPVKALLSGAVTNTDSSYLKLLLLVMPLGMIYIH